MCCWCKKIPYANNLLLFFKNVACSNYIYYTFNDAFEIEFIRFDLMLKRLDMACVFLDIMLSSFEIQLPLIDVLLF